MIKFAGTKSIDKKIEDAEKLIEKLEEQKERRLAKTKIICSRNQTGHGCGATFEIRDIEYIATHWYDSAVGYSGGDWYEGEGNWDCPECGHRNRLAAWGVSKDEEKRIKRMKKLFKSVIEEYDD